LTRLFDADVDFLAHNGKFDVRFLIHQLGVTNARIDQDSLIAHYTVNENMHHGLKELLFNYFGIGDYEGQLVQRYLKSKKDFYSKVPSESLMYYNALDVCYMLQLWDELEVELRDEGLYVQPYKYPMMAAQMPILRMELKGIPVDTEAFQRISEDLGQEKERLRLQLCQMCDRDFNPGSWQQVKPIMYDYYGMPLVSGYKYNRGSTNAKARTAILQKIDPESEAAQWLRLLGRYKSISKLKSTYVDGLFDLLSEFGEEDRVHPDGLVYGTEHGRLSYRAPPIQSYPKPGTNRPGEKDWGALIRGAFYAPPGWVVLQADYSQAELRTAAGLSGDTFLIGVYERDGDLHSEVAAALYGPNFTKRHRQICKYFNFAFLYGGTEKSFVADIGMPMEEAREFVRRHKRSMPQLVAWRDTQSQLMKSQGYVTTVTNRRRRFPLITRANMNEARKSSTNAPVAGTASDLTLMSLIEIDKWLQDTHLSDQAYIIINVHDSIVLLVREDIVHSVAVCARQIMEDMGSKWFPMLPWKVDIEVGPSWGALRAYDL
jgi:DNA polymerase-1